MNKTEMVGNGRGKTTFLKKSRQKWMAATGMIQYNNVFTFLKLSLTEKHQWINKVRTKNPEGGICFFFPCFF